jgi:hypothetical protein
MSKKNELWKAIACMGTCANTTAEPTVDDTFRKVTAFDLVSASRNCSASVDDNEIKRLPVGDYTVDLSLRAEGSNKIFVYALFVNGIETILQPSDKGEGHVTMTGAVWLPENATVDLRQKSTDGGIALTVSSVSLRLIRQNSAPRASV